MKAYIELARERGAVIFMDSDSYYVVEVAGTQQHIYRGRVKSFAINYCERHDIPYTIS